MFCWHFDATVSKGSFYIKDSRNSRRRERSWLCNLPDASHRSSRNHFSTVIALVLRFVLSSKYCRTNRNFSKKDTFGKKLINMNIIETLHVHFHRILLISYTRVCRQVPNHPCSSLFKKKRKRRKKYVRT